MARLSPWMILEVSSLIKAIKFSGKTNLASPTGPVKIISYPESFSAIQTFAPSGITIDFCCKKHTFLF